MVQKGLLDFFEANYFSQRRPPVSQSVNANRQLGTPKQFFVIFLEFILVAKFKASFIEIISHFKSDIRSCRCKNSSIKQASCMIGGLDPPDPPPWTRHCTSGHALRCSQYVSSHYTAQQVTRRVSLLYSFGYIRLY